MSTYFWPFALLATCLFCITLEACIPSAGVLSVLAGSSFVGAVVCGFLNFGLYGGTAFLIFCTSLAPLVIWSLVKIWPNTPIGKRILIDLPLADDVVPKRLDTLKELIGKTAEAVSPMLPSGAIRLDGKTLDAVSEGMYVEKGTWVEIVAVRGNHLVVRPTDQPPIAQTDKEAEAMMEQPVENIVPDPFDD